MVNDPEQSNSKLVALARDIKLSHSLFALPFALLATFLAADGFAGWDRLGLIVLCMFFARTFAMLANRYTDRAIDGNNPRTQNRALPARKVTPRDVRIVMAICALGLCGGAAAFGVVDDNWWPLIFSPLILAWLGAYGLMKRYTLLCHFFLGTALAISPPAAALAINPHYLSQPALWLLSGFVLLWVAGFDVIYAVQDIAADRRDGLHSIPARFGAEHALLIAKATHVAALLLLAAAGVSAASLGDGFKAGVVVVGVLLVIEHRAAARGRFTMAFFTLNGVISLLLGGLGIADVMHWI